MSSKQSMEDLRRQARDSTGAQRVLALVELGKEHDRLTREEAGIYAREAVDLARKLISDVGGVDNAEPILIEALAKALHGLAWWMIADHDSANAIPLLEEALTYFKDLGNWREYALTIKNYAIAFRLMWRYDKESEFLNKGLALVERENLNDLQLIFNTLLALNLQGLGHAEEALKVLAKAQGLISDTTGIDEQLELLYASAIVNHKQGLYTEARGYYERLIDALRATDKKHNLLGCLANFGQFLMTNNDHESALKMFEEALVLGRELQADFLLTVALRNIGHIFAQYGELDRSIAAWNECLELFQSLRDTGGMSMALTELGRINMIAGHDQEAADKLAKIEALMDDMGPSPDYFNAIRFLAEYSEDKRILHKVLTYLQAELNKGNAQWMNQTRDIALTFGIIYHRLGRNAEARTEFYKALAQREVQTSLCKQADLLVHIAKFEISVGREDVAHNHLRNALYAAGECHDWMVKRKIRQELRNFHEQRGEFEKALDQHKEMELQEKNVLFAQISNRIKRLTRDDEIRGIMRKLESAEQRKRIAEQSFADIRRQEKIIDEHKKQRAATLRILYDILHRGLEQPIDALQNNLRSALAEVSDVERGKTDFDSPAEEQAELEYDFTQALTRKFPKLTKREIKVAALLRLNMSTKEVAQILNVSARAIETYRYRIRQKLKLESGADLPRVLQELTADN